MSKPAQIAVLLLLAVGLHIWAAVTLARENRAARPVGYRRLQHQSSDYASRTMVWSGPLLALFVIYRLLHLTTGQAHENYIPGDVYHNVVNSFRVWPIAAVYAVANAALGFHVYHGAWSLLQTLGINHPRYNDLMRSVAVAIGLIVLFQHTFNSCICFIKF